MPVKPHTRVRTIAVTAMLGAAASVLMLLEFPIPFLMPAFVKMDISELPALLAAFSLGPVSGGAVCLIKNLVNLPFSYSGGVGELCNFILGLCFVVPAGWIYRAKKTRTGALIGALAGSAAMAACSVPVNYYIIYPFYTNLMPLESIIEAYQQIYSGINGLLACLLLFNLPFTLVKGLLNMTLTFLIYKPLSPLLHGRRDS